MSRASSRSLSLLFAVSAVRGIGAQIFMTFLPVYAVSVVSMTTSQIGIVSTIATGVSVIFLPLFGYLSDAIGRRSVMMLSTVLRALAPLVVLLMRNYYGILLAYILSQLSMYSWTPARGAFVAENVSKRSIGKAFAALSLPMQLSRAVVPYISGLIIVYLGYDIIFTAASFLMILGMIFILGIEEGSKNKTYEKFSIREFIRGMIPKRKELGLQTFFIIDRVSWRFWMPMMNSYFKEYLGFTEDIIGLISTTRGIVSSIAVIPSGHLVDKIGYRLSLLFSEITGALAALILIIGKTPLEMILASAFIGLSVAFWGPGFNVSVSRITDNKTELGRVYSRANFYRIVASVPSPWIGGILYNIAPALMFFSGLLGLLGNCFLILRIKESCL